MTSRLPNLGGDSLDRACEDEGIANKRPRRPNQTAMPRNQVRSYFALLRIMRVAVAAFLPALADPAMPLCSHLAVDPPRVGAK